MTAAAVAEARGSAAGAEPAGGSGDLFAGRGWNWAEMERVYGRSRRSIEKWRGAPLDRPEEMAEWWRRNRKHRVPPVLLALEAREAGEGREVPAVGEAEEQVDLEGCEARGAGEMLDQVRKVTALYYGKLQAALRAGDVVAARSAEEGWNRAALRQRQWEKDVTRIQLEQGEALTIAEVRAEAVPRLMTVRRAFEDELTKHIGRDAALDRMAEMFEELEAVAYLRDE